MTTTTDTYQITPHVQIAIQHFLETERAKLLVDRKQAALDKALRLIDCRDGSDDLRCYYAETQKIIDRYDAKREALGLS